LVFAEKSNALLTLGAFSVYDPYYGKNIKNYFASLICPEVNLQALRLVAISYWDNMGHTEKMHPLSFQRNLAF